MPAPDRSVLERREKIVASLREIVPGEGVIANDVAMRPYESDGLTAYRQLPMVVVLPETTEQVSKILKYCYENGIKVVPRGGGHVAFRWRPAARRRCPSRHGQI